MARKSIKKRRAVTTVFIGDITESGVKPHWDAAGMMLALERTFLSYVRTALTIVVAGASLAQFFRASIFQFAGWLLMPMGAIILYIGYYKYHKSRKAIERWVLR